MQLHGTPNWGARVVEHKADCQKKYAYGAWNKHCTEIILAEIRKRGLSVRSLTAEGHIKCRKDFKKRLEQGLLWSGELSDLLAFLEIDLVHAATTFVAREPLDAYNNGVFQNFTRIMATLIDQYESKDQQRLSHMEPLRPAVVEAMATKIIEQLANHQSRIDSARDFIGATARA